MVAAAGAATGARPGRRTGPNRVAAGTPREHRVVRATFSSLALIVIALGIGLILAAGLGAAIWGIATALHHAANN
jgi:type IV secretory pathway TrbD component